MAWRTFTEAPGERIGDEVLVPYVAFNLEVPEVRDEDRFAMLAWETGKVLLDEPVILRVVTFAWDAVADVTLRSALGPAWPGDEYVMQRTADLAVRRLLALP